VPDAGGFGDWVADLFASARDADGYLTGRASDLDNPTFDPAVLVTFRTEEALHRWLDGADRRRVLESGGARGYWSKATDLVLVAGDALPAGVSVFLQSVTPGREADFIATQALLATLAATFPGNAGTIVFPAEPDGEWMSVVRFRQAHQLTAWMRSGERARVLPQVRADLTKNFSEIALTTAYGSTIRTDNGQTRITPGWKIAMLVLLTLYPTVMLLSRFLGPTLDSWGAAPWFAFFLSNIVSVVALQWLLMPAASKVFHRWLDPVDGAGLRFSLTGAVIILVGYLATLLLFAIVKDLQFWDYAD